MIEIRAVIASTAAAVCTLATLGACSSGDGSGASSSSTSSSTSSSSSSPTTDYKDEATEAARAWLEDDRGRVTTKNGTGRALEIQKQEDAAFKKGGLTTKGSDSVISIEVDDDLTNTTRVTLDMCTSTDMQLMKDGKNVRTDVEGNPVKPGDHQLMQVEMRTKGEGEPWLVADSKVQERSC